MTQVTTEGVKSPVAQKALKGSSLPLDAPPEGVMKRGQVSRWMHPPCGVTLRKKPVSEVAVKLRGQSLNIDISFITRCLTFMTRPLRIEKAAAEIRLVTAVEQSYKDKKQHSISKRHLEDATRRLRADGFLVSPVTKKGHPADILIAEARQWKTDCIFLGTRGLSGTQRLFLGSVSAVVAAHAPCSVEIVK